MAFKRKRAALNRGDNYGNGDLPGRVNRQSLPVGAFTERRQSGTPYSLIFRERHPCTHIKGKPSLRKGKG